MQVTIVQQILNKQTYKDKKHGEKVALAFNSEEGREYLQYLTRKYAGKHVIDITERKDGGKNNE